MGITVHYRGSIEDPDRVEDLEDRVVDCGLQVGSFVRIWRSFVSGECAGFLRGVLLDLAPGQETTSLLLSPEGFLVPHWEIEVTERDRRSEPPWCFVQTHFGSMEGHVQLIELLAAIKDEFLPNLEIIDEGGYWPTRNLREFVPTFQEVQSSIAGLTASLERMGISGEATEDPGIIASRLERVAQQVHQVISRPAEHAPVHFDDGEDEGEDKWDALYRENRRKQERLHRAIEQRQQQGEDSGDALENAMRDEGLIDLPGESNLEGGRFDDQHFVDDDWNEGNDSDEPWLASLPAEIVDDDDDFDAADEIHPLQERASDLFMRLHKVMPEDSTRNSHQSILSGGCGDLIGGLAQALSSSPSDVVGLSTVQLKRALRGTAFARGALIPLQIEGILPKEACHQLASELEFIAAEIQDELARLRDRPPY